MKISKSDTKVRATVLLLVTRGAKATIIRLRNLYKRIRSPRYDTGKTGGPIATDRSANRQNEINEARVETIEELAAAIHCEDDDDTRNSTDENLENELRELVMAAAAWADFSCLNVTPS